jgi:hypothetical protein
MRQNLIHEEIKSRLNFGQRLLPSVQNLLSSHLLCKDKDKIHGTTIFLVVLTWSLSSGGGTWTEGV